MKTKVRIMGVPMMESPSKEIREEIKDDYDFVEHPAHYNGHTLHTKDGSFEYETINYLEALVKRLDEYIYPDESGSIYCAAKYLDRIGGGKPDGDKTPRQKIAEDLRKISWYCTHAADLIESNGIEDKHKE